MRPRLPEDPTATQLEAWIALADQVQGEEFRGAVRSYLQDAYGTFPGRSLATAPVWDFVHKEGQQIGERIWEAYRSGLPADSPRAQELALGMADQAAAAFGQAKHESPERLARALLMAEKIRREPSEEDARYAATHGRYLSLVDLINETPTSTGEEEPEFFAWMATALLASVQ
jgi:hypothetical protein